MPFNPLVTAVCFETKDHGGDLKHYTINSNHISKNRHNIPVAVSFIYFMSHVVQWAPPFSRGPSTARLHCG